MNELKPCPFCGGKVTMQAPNIHRKTCVSCLSCLASSGWGYQDEAITAWNQRFNGWVSVKKSLPAVGEYGDVDVLVYMEDGFIATASYDENYGWELWADAGEVTHWMPLPDAPEVQMKELKPCPFCGGTAEIETSNDFLYWRTAVCSECRTGTRGYKRKDEAIAAWNRRYKEEKEGEE